MGRSQILQGRREVLVYGKTPQRFAPKAAAVTRGCSVWRCKQECDWRPDSFALGPDGLRKDLHTSTTDLPSALSKLTPRMRAHHNCCRLAAGFTVGSCILDSGSHAVVARTARLGRTRQVVYVLPTVQYLCGRY